jgi:phage baseplate assembly protein W
MDFIGAPYPIVPNVHGLLASPGSLEQIKADLLVLLLTNPGERVMLPDYGTPLRDLMFEPNDATLRQRAKDMIALSIRKWEPRITVDQIEVANTADFKDLAPEDPRQNLDNILAIKIVFKDPQNILAVDDLRLELPLGGANG